MRRAVIIVLCLLVSVIVFEAADNAFSGTTPPLAKVLSNE